MKGTIVQQYGPIYGEPVNGTVFGRPNGSVYVPPNNIIAIELSDPNNSKYIADVDGNIYITKSDGTANGFIYFTAQAQDLSSLVRMSLYDDAECTQLLKSRDYAAGLFNWRLNTFGLVGDIVLVDGKKYYAVAKLVNSGVAVATSNIIELTGVVIDDGE